MIFVVYSLVTTIATYAGDPIDCMTNLGELDGDFLDGWDLIIAKSSSIKLFSPVTASSMARNHWNTMWNQEPWRPLDLCLSAVRKRVTVWSTTRTTCGSPSSPWPRLPSPSSRTTSGTTGRVRVIATGSPIKTGGKTGNKIKTLNCSLPLFWRARIY